MLAVPALEVRRVLPGDMDEVVELEKASFDDPYPRYFLEQLAAAHPDTFLVASAEGEILGYTVVDMWEDHDHLISIAVHSEWRRRGIGRRLLLALDAALGNRRPMRLEVRRSNTEAIQFYLKNLQRSSNLGLRTSIPTNILAGWIRTRDSPSE